MDELSRKTVLLVSDAPSRAPLGPILALASDTDFQYPGVRVSGVHHDVVVLTPVESSDWVADELERLADEVHGDLFVGFCPVRGNSLWDGSVLDGFGAVDATIGADWGLVRVRRSGDERWPALGHTLGTLSRTAVVVEDGPAGIAGRDAPAPRGRRDSKKRAKAPVRVAVGAGRRTKVVAKVRRMLHRKLVLLGGAVASVLLTGALLGFGTGSVAVGVGSGFVCGLIVMACYLMLRVRGLLVAVNGRVSGLAAASRRDLRLSRALAAEVGKVRRDQIVTRTVETILLETLEEDRRR